MFKKHNDIKFYLISLFIISFLLLLFYNRMESTYEAKNNFIIFQEISHKFLTKEKINLDTSHMKNNENIYVDYKLNNLTISVKELDYRSCLKYGVDYIDSHFTSILINDFLFTRKSFITRDLILEKCNKISNTIILNQ